MWIVRFMTLAGAARRSAAVVFMKCNDVMLYIVGTGEYDELMRASSS